ncbi:MAG: zinc-finger domain-containing protein [Pseudomonadota bacterium]
MQPPETIEVENEVVACDGGGGALGHPRVFLNMEGQGHVVCPYCGRDFVLSAMPAVVKH